MRRREPKDGAVRWRPHAASWWRWAPPLRKSVCRPRRECKPGNPRGKPGFLTTKIKSRERQTLRWRGESTANSSLKLGADSGRVMDDSGIVKRCFALEFRRKLSSLPWQPAPDTGN